MTAITGCLDMAGLAHTDKANGFPGGLLKCISPGPAEETLSRGTK